jgi:proteic killer suppression protein
VIIGTFRHKGLRRLYEDDDPSGLPPASVSKIRRMLTELEFATNLAQASTMPGWNLHPLHGDRRGTYALRITGNWRLTFRLQGTTVTDLDLEDYH